MDGFHTLQSGYQMSGHSAEAARNMALNQLAEAARVAKFQADSAQATQSYVQPQPHRQNWSQPMQHPPIQYARPTYDHVPERFLYHPKPKTSGGRKFINFLATIGLAAGGIYYIGILPDTSENNDQKIILQPTRQIVQPVKHAGHKSKHKSAKPNHPATPPQAKIPEDRTIAVQLVRNVP